MIIFRNSISKRLLNYAFILMSLCIFSSSCASLYRKPRININIQPTRPADIRANSIGIFNFKYLDEGENRQLSLPFAEFLQEELLKRNFFRRVGTTKCNYKSVDQAVESGRQMGYDLILIGAINKYYEGMRSADSEVFITLKIVETGDSETLWHLNGQMAAKYHPGRDYIFFQTNTKPAASPKNLGQSILKRMVKILCSSKNDA